MKIIKIFENFTKEVWQNQIIKLTGMLDTLYDLKDVSMEYLDISHPSELDDEILTKKIIFTVDIYAPSFDPDKQPQFIGNLCGGEYSYENTDIENSIYWSEDITAPIQEVSKEFREGNLILYITFCIVIGEEGDYKTINDDTSKVLGRISEMHPEVKFDTFNPWDIN